MRIYIKKGVKMSNYDGKIEPLPTYNNQGNEHYLSSDKPDTYLWLAEENTKQVKEIKRLQEQLKEANDTLIKSQNMKQPDRNNYVAQYLLKWGVK